MARSIDSVSVKLRRSDGEIAVRTWPHASVDDLLEFSTPWRTFRWYYGQKHYSGFYWSSTMRSHVIYESRLELTRLIYADFTRDGRAIFAQPFLITAEIDGTLRRHVPDFLILRDGMVPLVVDVKPRHLLTRPKIAFSLGWARKVMESCGWEFQAWCEPPEEEMANLRFLAGYRRDWLFEAEMLEEMRGHDLHGATLGEAFHAFPRWPDELVRAAVLHLLWNQDLSTNLSEILSEQHVLRQEPATVVGAGMNTLPDPIEDYEYGDTEVIPPQRAGNGGTGGRMSGDGAVRVGVGTRFHYDGEVVTVEEMFGSAAGNEILVKDGRGRRFRLSLREVLASGRARVIAAKPGPSSGDPGETASVVLAQLDDDELEKVRERAAHLNEVICGFRSGSPELAAPGEPRLQYAPGTPKMARYQAKADELGVGLRTLTRWVSAFQLEREAALTRDRPERAVDAGGVGRADPRWVEMALEIMAEYEDDSTPSQALVIRSMRPRLDARYGKGEVRVPSRPTAYRWLRELEKRRPTFRLSAKRNRDIAARPTGVYGKLRPTRPGEYLLMDTNRLDVFALDPMTLRWVQPELTVAMDWYDRCIAGLRLTPVSTKSVDVAATLFQAYRPRQAGKDWPSHAVWPDHGVPRAVLLDRDAIEGPMADAAARVTGQGAAGPALVPETLVVDHGKVYVSEHITSVCQRLGLSIQPARLRTGRDKGPIERFFLTLRKGLLETLPGYKGPDIYARGVNPEGEAYFFLNELEAIIREWVAVVYHHRPHDGLVDPRVPGLRLSPAAMFDHGIARAGYIEVPRDPDLGFEFLKTEWKPIHSYGVETRRCRYNGPGLNGLRNQTSPYTGPRAKGGWPIQVDPDDITRVYFRRPETRKWHTLTWEHAPAMKFPVSEEALELARQLAAKKYPYPDDESAMADLLERWNLGLGMTRAERRMALRMAREQSAIELPSTDAADEAAALPSVARVLTADSVVLAEGDEDPEPEPYEGQQPGDDDDDDELGGPGHSLEGPDDDDDDDFYADALEDA
ncbi:TnsA-like heteromeric transposase endonuclease subunit [Streptomyces fulvoviolaceus]|uniref:TnsA-like heteromeric transposase endonuclease subunit n=1 Tax=Streptomyces fulvoviolaceus TaxID=285535 RepID=UPI00099794C2|nr:TnsA-like heteromeric transposase endonuclease subunit [Streptomyces fulvoviolaceus]